MSEQTKTNLKECSIGVTDSPSNTTKIRITDSPSNKTKIRVTGSSSNTTKIGVTGSPTEANPKIGVTGSPSNTTKISIDITSTSESLLGKMVYLEILEEEKTAYALGQITSIETRNRWHENMAFKGIIKQKGSLPHLSGRADTRSASLNIQSCFIKQENSKEPPIGHILGISPATGIPIKKMDDAFMKSLVEGYGKVIQYIGTVYGSKNVNMPMWFRHFGKEDHAGVGDALHIGVFGKTGSGKTVMSSLMLLNYAKTKKMNLLVFDPQGQFYKDADLLPEEQKLKEAITSIEGAKYKKYKLSQEKSEEDSLISLPHDDFELFGQLLLESGYIRRAFNLTTDDKKEDMKNLIVKYLSDYKSDKTTPIKSLKLDKLLKCLQKPKNLKKIYRKADSQNKLKEAIKEEEETNANRKTFEKIQNLFTRGTDIREVIRQAVSPEEKGHFIIINTSLKGSHSDKYQALFLDTIEKTIIAESEKHYHSGKSLSNALIVMDEAHRFISQYSEDDRKKELTRSIVDAVRTTRKYGVGHMFITQSLESLHKEIIKQLRIHVFGYGLTTGDELRKIKHIINNESALNLYKSFIDPSNTKRYPFMFLGAVSPLSLSGSPLFIEAYNTFEDYKTNNLPLAKSQNKSS